MSATLMSDAEIDSQADYSPNVSLDVSSKPNKLLLLLCTKDRCVRIGQKTYFRFPQTNKKSKTGFILVGCFKFSGMFPDNY